MSLDLLYAPAVATALGVLLLAAPRRAVRRVLTIIWAADGFAIHASVAEAAASADALPVAVASAGRRRFR